MLFERIGIANDTVSPITPPPPISSHHTMASGGVNSPAPLLLLPLLLVVLLGCGRSAADSTPQQIHLSLTDDVTAVQVTYSTLQPGPARARHGRETPDTLVSAPAGHLN